MTEIETTWSILDLAEANEVLDYRAAVQAVEEKKIKNQSKGRK